jgi:hypothetical protein
MDWIADKGLYPSTRQKVLTTIKFLHSKEVKMCTYVAHYENNHGVFKNVWISEDGGFFEDKEILAWMPIPEPFQNS